MKNASERDTLVNDNSAEQTHLINLRFKESFVRDDILTIQFLVIFLTIKDKYIEIKSKNIFPSLLYRN